jgi:copper chaperone
MEKVKVKVTGMNCGHCKMNVEMSLKKLAGIDAAVADLSSGEVVLTGESIDLEQVRSAVEKIGYAYGGPA